MLRPNDGVMPAEEKFEVCAVDIESRGVDHDSELTVIGFAVSGGYQLYLNTGGKTRTGCSGISSLNHNTVNKPVKIETHPTEEAMLNSALEFSNARLKTGEVLLTGFNAETWNGGFDIPHIRTRCQANNIEMILGNVLFCDIFEMKDMMNHSVQNNEVNDLNSLFEIYFPEAEDFDPADDQQPIVAYWHNEEFEKLLLHNLADLWKTRRLALMYDQYVPQSDWQLKPLGPPGNSL